MPTLEQNRQLWSESFDWSHQGDRWSANWGGVDMQWYGTLLPRIHAFLPTGTILEIAAGYGRWSQYLKDLCDRLLLIDMQAHCIEACRERFADETHIEYYVNDGRSLEMVPDHSVDFVFSFDSLVHADSSVIEAYLEQLATKLTPNGVGFFHHSNLGAYFRYFSLTTRLPMSIRDRIYRYGWADKDHWRDLSMTAEKFCEIAARYGLQCIGQELVNWSSKRQIDGFTTFCKEGSIWSRPNVVVRNSRFMEEVRRWGDLAELYSDTSWPHTSKT